MHCGKSPFHCCISSRAYRGCQVNMYTTRQILEPTLFLSMIAKRILEVLKIAVTLSLKL